MRTPLRTSRVPSVTRESVGSRPLTFKGIVDLTDITLNFVLNLLANLATALVLAGGAWAYVKRRRDRFSRFFNLPGGGQLHIYLSSIAIREQGTIATEPMRTGFHGEAISEMEFRHANRLSASLSGRTSALTIALLGPTAGLSQIASRVSSSPSFRNYPRQPEDEGEDPMGIASSVAYTKEGRAAIENLFLAKGCTIIVGSPRYNILSHYLTTQFVAGSSVAPKYEFFIFQDPDEKLDRNQGIRPRGTVDHPDQRVRHEARGFYLQYFVVEKIVRPEHTVFWCAGTSTNATAAALRELSNWTRMYKEEGDASFARLYELQIPIVTDAYAAQESDFNPDIMTITRVDKKIPSD